MVEGDRDNPACGEAADGVIEPFMLESIIFDEEEDASCSRNDDVACRVAFVCDDLTVVYTREGTSLVTVSTHAGQDGTDPCSIKGTLRPAPAGACDE